MENTLVAPTQELKICTKCLKPQPLDNYTLRTKNGNTRQSVCKDCIRTYRKNQNIKTEIWASSWKTKGEDEAVFVLEADCPIKREEGKQTRDLYRISINSPFPPDSKIIVECCCKEFVGGKLRTAPCPHFQGFEKTMRKHNKQTLSVRVVQCSQYQPPVLLAYGQTQDLSPTTQVESLTVE